MKVAVLIPGLTRTYKETYESFFKNIIEPNSENNKIDVYLAFWDYTHGRHGRNREKGRNISKLSSGEIDNIIRVYDPRKYLVMDDYAEKNKYFDSITDGIIETIGLPTEKHNPRAFIRNGMVAQTYGW